ncbi:hypothetical protein [Variovorax sp. JS1663]|uniref:hypothetical protein n=1 Tax=Variovorax sp. JS1663 TaxID=1851577 RepID=UPI00118042DB|nr:hypothetical protein [Variovorax sp. JS1663]
MSSVFSKSSSSAPTRDPLIAASLGATIAAARSLRANARVGSAGQPLRGKNLAVLLGATPNDDVQRLHLAAQALGARVADLRFAETGAGRGGIRALGRMLGRMYDAVDCEGIPDCVARQIEQEAGVPVYQGLCLDEHAARLAADLMTLQEQHAPSSAPLVFLGDGTTERARRFVAAAREAGFQVLLNENNRPDVHGAVLLVDATHTARWTLIAGRPIDEAQRSENHRCVIQAMLLDVLVRG